MARRRNGWEYCMVDEAERPADMPVGEIERVDENGVHIFYLRPDIITKLQAAAPAFRTFMRDQQRKR